MSTLDSIITLSQLQAGKVTILLKNTNLNAAIKNVYQAFKDKADEKTITLSMDILDDVTAYTDQLLFKQLLQRILDNAIKFTEKGKVVITSRMIMENDVKWQTIRIKDTGIGIDKDFFELIYHEFRQVSEGYNRKFQGSGLGLTISKKTCDLLKGKITLESEPGKGSAFTIWLPASKKAKTHKIKPEEIDTILAPAPIKKSIKSPVILLVEDNLVNKNLIELFLKPHYKMDHAFDGDSAVSMAKKNRYDGILMDINLGAGMDGIQATRMIKAIPEYENIPIIAVTGYTMIGDREKLLAQGCTHYIGKPFEKANFQAIVRDAIFGKGK